MECRDQFGSPRNFPPAIVAEAIDRERAVADGGWIAAPLALHAASGEVLACFMHRRNRGVPCNRAIIGGGRRLWLGARCGPHARVSAAADRAAGSDSGNRQPVEPDHEMEPLLVQMAEAATRLLAADRRQHLSLGPAEPHARRPPGAGRARGRAADSRRRGVVGQVVQQRRAAPRRRRARPGADQSPGRYASSATRPARCCACRLRGRSGELFGAFEVINKLHGNFTADDEAGAGRAGRPRRRGPGKHAAARAAADRAIGRSPSRRPKACG